MVTIKPGDDVAQRPDTVVEYSLKGWTGGAVTVERFRPSKDVTLPTIETRADRGLQITVRADAGVPGAKYRVCVGDQSWWLTVGWYIPCQPVKVDGQTTGVSREVIHDGHVWIASPLGGGNLVPIKAPVRRR